MSLRKNERSDSIDHFLDENLKKVFSDYQGDDMPTEITDLLSVLRAQDEEMKHTK